MMVEKTSLRLGCGVVEALAAASAYGIASAFDTNTATN
jgi:hypothetical protein